MSSRAVPLSLKNTITSSPTTCTNHTLQRLLNWHWVIVGASNNMLEHIALFFTKKMSRVYSCYNQYLPYRSVILPPVLCLQSWKQGSVRSGAPVPDGWFVFSRKTKTTRRVHCSKQRPYIEQLTVASDVVPLVEVVCIFTHARESACLVYQQITL